MNPEQILIEVNRIYPNLKVTEVVGLSVIDNGKFLHVAAHAPIREAEGRTFWNHRYFQFTVDRYNFGHVVYQDSNVTDSDNFKTAEETRQKATNYLTHALKKL